MSPTAFWRCLVLPQNPWPVNWRPNPCHPESGYYGPCVTPPKRGGVEDQSRIFIDPTWHRPKDFAGYPHLELLLWYRQDYNIASIGTQLGILKHCAVVYLLFQLLLIS